jgi:hypothetical protein
MGGSSDCANLLHAFVWEEGGLMRDLNRLIPPGSGLQISNAFNINDCGGILAKSFPIGTTPNDDADLSHIVLLIPCAQEDHEGECSNHDRDGDGVPPPVSTPATSRAAAIPRSSHSLTAEDGAVGWQMRMGRRLVVPKAAAHRLFERGKGVSLIKIHRRLTPLASTRNPCAANYPAFRTAEISAGICVPFVLLHFGKLAGFHPKLRCEEVVERSMNSGGRTRGTTSHGVEKVARPALVADRIAAPALTVRDRHSRRSGFKELWSIHPLGTNLNSVKKTVSRRYCSLLHWSGLLTTPDRACRPSW